MPFDAKMSRRAAMSVMHSSTMFSVTEIQAAAIRRAFECEGEWSAAIEVRRLFPGITESAKARECARIIAGWRPILPRPVDVGAGGTETPASPATDGA